MRSIIIGGLAAVAVAAGLTAAPSAGATETTAPTAAAPAPVR